MLSRYIFGCACHHLAYHWSNWSQQILSTAPLMDNHQFEQVRGSTKHYTTLVSCFHPLSGYNLSSPPPSSSSSPTLPVVWCGLTAYKQLSLCPAPHWATEPPAQESQHHHHRHCFHYNHRHYHPYHKNPHHHHQAPILTTISIMVVVAAVLARCCCYCCHHQKAVRTRIKI